MQHFTCPYGGEIHEYPDDWIFGGPEGMHPAADPRFTPTHYQYLDAEYGFCFITGSYLCDDEALDKFTLHAATGAQFIAVRRPGESKFSLLPFIYIAETDTVHPYEWDKPDTP